MANVTKIWVSVPDVATQTLVQDALVRTSNGLITILSELPHPITNLARLTGVIAYVGLEGLMEDEWFMRRDTMYFHCVAVLKEDKTPDDVPVWKVYLHKSIFHQAGLQPSYLDYECDNILHFLNFGHLYKRASAI